MNPMHKVHLSTSRKKLDERPYINFLQEYIYYLSYNVKDDVHDNVPGSYVSHTSSDENGYFNIPDDGCCSCDHEKNSNNYYMNFIARCVHRGELTFCGEIVHMRYFFHAMIPFSFAVESTVAAETLGKFSHMAEENGSNDSLNVSDLAENNRLHLSSFLLPPKIKLIQLLLIQ